MTFGPIVEKIADLPEEYLPRLDKCVDELLAEADKAWNEEMDKAIAKVDSGEYEPLDLKEHFRMVDDVCARAKQGV